MNPNFNASFSPHLSHIKSLRYPGTNVPAAGHGVNYVSLNTHFSILPHFITLYFLL